MPALTLYPGTTGGEGATISTGNWSSFGAAGLPGGLSDGSDSTGIQTSAGGLGELNSYPLTNTPANFYKMASIEAHIRYSVSGWTDDTLGLTVLIYTTTERATVFGPTATGITNGQIIDATVPLTIVGSPTKTTWDSQRHFALTQSITSSMGADPVVFTVYELTFVGWYYAGVPPTGLTGSFSGGQITLNWTAPSGGTHTHYVIERNGVAIESNLSSSATSYVDTSPPEGDVVYEVIPYYGTGNDGEPATVTVRTLTRAALIDYSANSGSSSNSNTSADHAQTFTLSETKKIQFAQVGYKRSTSSSAITSGTFKLALKNTLGGPELAGQTISILKIPYATTGNPSFDLQPLFEFNPPVELAAGQYFLKIDWQYTAVDTGAYMARYTTANDYAGGSMWTSGSELATTDVAFKIWDSPTKTRTHGVDAYVIGRRTRSHSVEAVVLIAPMHLRPNAVVGLHSWTTQSNSPNDADILAAVNESNPDDATYIKGS